MQIVCSVNCAYEYQKKQRQKRFKSHTKTLRKKWGVDTPDYKKLAQMAFNAYIRQRDKDLPCISCGVTSAKWDAGHYRTTAAAPQLRFNTWNCHKQCSVCNQHKSGNLIEYRKGLIERIGKDCVELIENNSETRRYTQEDYKRIAKIFREKLRRLKD